MRPERQLPNEQNACEKHTACTESESSPWQGIGRYRARQASRIWSNTVGGSSRLWRLVMYKLAFLHGRHAGQSRVPRKAPPPHAHYNVYGKVRYSMNRNQLRYEYLVPYSYNYTVSYSCHNTVHLPGTVLVRCSVLVQYRIPYEYIVYQEGLTVCSLDPAGASRP